MENNFGREDTKSCKKGGNNGPPCGSLGVIVTDNSQNTLGLQPSQADDEENETSPQSNKVSVDQDLNPCKADDILPCDISEVQKNSKNSAKPSQSLAVRSPEADSRKRNETLRGAEDFVVGDAELCNVNVGVLAKTAPPDNILHEQIVVADKTANSLGLKIPHMSPSKRKKTPHAENSVTHRDDHVCEPVAKDHHPYSFVTFLLDVFSIATYVADVGSDIWVAALYCQDGDWWWFGLTLVFILAPCVVMGGNSVFQSCRDEDSFFQILFAFAVMAIPGGPVFLYVWIIIQQVKAKKTRGRRKHELDEEVTCSVVGLASLRLIEAFMEAAPQLVLQLHIIFSGHGSTKPVMMAVQWASVGTSLGSLSWAVIAYHRADRLDKGKVRISYLGLVLQFLWRTIIIAARVVSLALFASVLPYGIFILTLVHFILMDIWLTLMSNSYQCANQSFAAVFSFFPQAFVYIFCDIYFKGSPTRFKYIFYYILMYLENMSMLFAWYFMTIAAEIWYRCPVIIIVVGGFLLGVFFQIMYYLKFHPNNSIEDAEHPRIRAWISCNARD